MLMDPVRLLFRVIRSATAGGAEETRQVRTLPVILLSSFDLWVILFSFYTYRQGGSTSRRAEELEEIPRM